MVRMCPKCGKLYAAVPALSRADNHTEICPECGMCEAMEAMRWGVPPQQRTRMKAEQTGNRWAMENFGLTHS